MARTSLGKQSTLVLGSLRIIAADNESKEDEMCGACSMNGGEEERVWVVGGKARGKEASRKTKT
jgi:hypothetical protein